MRLFTTIAAATLLTLGSAGLASAADLITVPLRSGNAEIPIADTRFDWNGFYSGVYGAVQSSDNYGTQYGLGIEAGVNAQFDFFLIGAEVALQGLTGDALETTYGQVLGRAGVVLTDDVLLYAAAGYGFDLGGSDADLLAGGGVEIAASDNVSLRAQYLHGFAQEGDNPKDQVTLGANFHF